MEKTQKIVQKGKKQLRRGKKGILSIVFGRTGVLVILIILQILVLTVGFHYIRQFAIVAHEAVVFLGFLLVVGIIRKPGNPAFKIAWIVPILMVPVFGSLFYLFFNTQLREKQINKEVLKEIEVTEKLVSQKGEVKKQLQEESQSVANLASYLRRASGSAVHTNTDMKYFPSGEDAFETIIEKISNAKKYVFLEFFIINQGVMWDTLLEILKSKVKEGVEVRVLYDGMSDYFSLPRKYARSIEETGIKCKVFAPIVPLLSTVQNNRDHRKILIVDGEIAFTGGINLADEYINRKKRFGYWKDCCVMFTGDAVQDFTLMFLQMWNVVVHAQSKSRKQLKNRVPDPKEYEGYINHPIPKQEGEGLGYVIPYDDNPLDDEPTGENVYLDILYTAERYVHIMTPYLVLDHEMTAALCYAAKRGVDVKIIMPSIPDKKYAFLLARTYYTELLEAGIKIYEYRPGFVHSKLFLSDDCKAAVGSINLDFRSLYLSFECAAYIYKNKEIHVMEEDYQNTLRKCDQITTDLYKKMPVWERACGNLLRLFAPLM